MSKKTSIVVKWVLSVCSLILTIALVVSLELTRQDYADSLTRIHTQPTAHQIL